MCPGLIPHSVCFELRYSPNTPPLAALARHARAVSLSFQLFGADVFHVQGAWLAAAIVIDFDPAAAKVSSGAWRHPHHVFCFLRGSGCLRCGTWLETKIQLCRRTEIGLGIVDRSFYHHFDD